MRGQRWWDCWIWARAAAAAGRFGQEPVGEAVLVDVMSAHRFPVQGAVWGVRTSALLYAKDSAALKEGARAMVSAEPAAFSGTHLCSQGWLMGRQWVLRIGHRADTALTHDRVSLPLVAELMWLREPVFPNDQHMSQNCARVQGGL